MDALGRPWAGMPSLIEDLKILRKHLNDKAPQSAKKCPICGAGEWQIVKHISAMLSYILGKSSSDMASIDPKEVLPVAHTVCTNCFFIVSFVLMPILNGC